MFEQYFGKWHFIHTCLSTKFSLFPTLFCKVLVWGGLLLLWCLLVEIFDIFKAKGRGEGMNVIKPRTHHAPALPQFILRTRLSGRKGLITQPGGSAWLRKPWPWPWHLLHRMPTPHRSLQSIKWGACCRAFVQSVWTHCLLGGCLSPRLVCGSLPHFCANQTLPPAPGGRSRIRQGS